jgi:hypothetical protein
MDSLLNKMGPKMMQQMVSFAAMGAVLGAVAHIASPTKEDLNDVPVRSDFLSTDTSFIDAILMMKPYRPWDVEAFDGIIKRADALVYYMMRVSDTNDKIDLKMQFYALAAKRQIQELAQKLIDKVSRHMPEESVVAKEHMDALLTVVDTYLDNIQTESIENAKNI